MSYDSVFSQLHSHSRELLVPSWLAFDSSKCSPLSDAMHGTECDAKAHARCCRTSAIGRPAHFRLYGPVRFFHAVIALRQVPVTNLFKH